MSKSPNLRYFENISQFSCNIKSLSVCLSFKDLRSEWNGTSCFNHHKYIWNGNIYCDT